MDLFGAFKTEVFRPVITLAVPGVTAVTPYVPVVVQYNPELRTFWEAHPASFVALFVVAVLAAGVILEDFGARIEYGIWDELIERRSGTHHKDWRAYLLCEWEREPVGHRYLRTLLMRMKFELSFGLALLAGALGLLWLQVLKQPWDWLRFGLFSAVALLLSAYLLWESYGSAWTLAQTRHVILTKEPLKESQLHADLAHGRLVGVVRIQALGWGTLALLGMSLPSVIVPLFRVAPTETSTVLIRMVGVMAAALTLSGWYVATDSTLPRPRAIAAIGATTHLLMGVFVAMPRASVGWTGWSVAHVVAHGILLAAFARVAFMNASDAPAA